MKYKNIKITKNDNPWDVAKRSGCSLKQLCRVNGVSCIDELTEFSIIKIPTEKEIIKFDRWETTKEIIFGVIMIAMMLIICIFVIFLFDNIYNFFSSLDRGV